MSAESPGSLMREMGAKALKLGIPLSVQLDLTYRCNERGIHCYLDHDDHGEMTTAEIMDLLDQLAGAGVFFLILSGGEIFLRKAQHARGLVQAEQRRVGAGHDHHLVAQPAGGEVGGAGDGAARGARRSVS